MWAEGMTSELLQVVPSRFKALSRKLAVELYDTCPAAVRNRIDAINQQLSLSNNMLNGPQTLWIILDSFKHDDGLAGARSVTDLMDG